ncbi:unnamed protein product [Caenorhabditis sp. 36 PRJEB53466]|nr:unnamed protein product [Caenorhabditis sp. 36 PRJEB53466]
MFLEIFTVWLGLFSIAFTFLPMFMVLDWRKRGSAEGFSSVNFVLPMLVQSFWLRHGFMTNDQTNIIINSVNLVFFVFYISAFGYYQPKRKYLIGQLVFAAVVIKLAFAYVDTHDADKSTTLAGGIYEIKRAVSMGTTEYIPAGFQFAIFTLIVQWLLFGILHGNQFIAISNAAGLLVNIATISLYFFYPPLTWTVPIFNIPPQKQDAKKE